MPDDPNPPTPPTGDPSGDPPTPPTGGDGKPDPDASAKQALEVERTARKQAERERKAMQLELETLRQQGMSDTEKAIAEAKRTARAEALVEVGKRLVDAEVKAAVGTRQVDVDALLDGLDRSRFVGDDGEPDVKAIKAWVDRIAPPAAQQFGDPLVQGRRGDPPPASADMNQIIRRAAGRTA